MKEPPFYVITLLVVVCLVCALIGLYILVNFNQLFRRQISNNWVRRNINAWLTIFFMSAALTPLSGGFLYLLTKHGWDGILIWHAAATTANSLIVYNLAYWVTRIPALKKMHFAKQQLIIIVILMILVMGVNLPINYVAYDFQTQYLRYSAMSSIYLGGATGLVYSMTKYLDIERKRKFDEKELELSRLRELKTKAELDALHSKVNPHFLYNALNSIADLSITDGKKARKMTVALADLFRYSINYSNNNYSTLKDELEMAEVYLLIEKIRFEDKLVYSIHPVEELNHFLVPRFILQPLVENAVKHGLKATGQMTEIRLEVEKQGNGMVIHVADSGPDFPAHMNPGYGVKSVYDKLELLFPGQFELRFSNEPRKRVSIYIHKLIKHEQPV